VEDGATAITKGVSAVQQAASIGSSVDRAVGSNGETSNWIIAVGVSSKSVQGGIIPIRLFCALT
jgi:hypothetical protein